MRKPSQNDYKVHTLFKSFEGIPYAEAVKKTAAKLGYQVPAVYGILNRVNKWNTAPQDIMPDGHALKGVSSFVDGDGNIIRQWIKTNKEQDNWSALVNAALDRVSEITPLPVPPLGDRLIQLSTLAVYPLADLHVGLYAAQQETGTGWTLERAAKEYKAAFLSLVQSTPPAEQCILANLGDFTHIDDQSNATPKGTRLDASGRYSEVVAAALDVILFCVDTVLNRHMDVQIVWVSGNHDESTSIVMQAALERLYQQNPRVTVQKSQGRFFCQVFGKNLLGFSHGDTVKANDLPLVMATDYPQLWGQTHNRVWHIGHIHHKTMQEFHGCIVESHSSPSPRDAWHHDRGYRAQRGMTSIVYDTAGELSRHTVNL